MTDSESEVLGAARAAVLMLRDRHQAGKTTDRLEILVGYSGGCDSVVLLDALQSVAAGNAVGVTAMHVHHGLSPNADRWADFCAEECSCRGIALVVRRVSVARVAGESLEAAARAARYAAFASAAADAIALAHHADDQAETVLLQLLRGAGPHGLAAMPTFREDTRPVLMRPLLELPRSALLEYAQRRNLRWIEDESNGDTQLRRNFLRHEIAPKLGATFPGYPATLARSAGHCAEAAELLDELAALDAAGALPSDPDAPLTLDRARLRDLLHCSPARARNLLRWFLRRHGLQPPSTARLTAMLSQFDRATEGARVRIEHAGSELGIFRGRITVHAPAVQRFEATWRGEAELSLPHGTLAFVPTSGNGIATAKMRVATVTIRQRVGGERLKLGPDRPHRPLKKLLQDAAIAPWLRSSLPLVYCDGQLAAVPGIGVDAAFHPAAHEESVVLRWQPLVDSNGSS